MKKKIDIKKCTINFGVNTWNTYTPANFGFLAKWCATHATKFYMQEEEAKRKHIQFCFKMPTKCTIDDLRHILKCHLDNAKEWRNCVNYCTKERTRRGIMVSHKDRQKIIDLNKYLNLKGLIGDELNKAVYYNLVANYYGSQTS